MKKLVFPRKIKYYIPLAVLFLLLFVGAPRVNKFKYSYRKGALWLQPTLVAQCDFPILKTQEQIDAEKRAKSQETIAYFKYDSSVTEDVLSSLKRLQFGEYDYLRKEIFSKVNSAYGRGVIPDRFFVDDDSFSHDVIYVEKSKRAGKVALGNIYTVSQLLGEMTGLVSRRIESDDIDSDSLLVTLGLKETIVPNLVYDKQNTQLIHKQTIREISPTSGIVTAGTVIVSEGEIVTAEIKQMLDSYKEEYDNNFGYYGNSFFYYLGKILMCLLIVGIVFIAIVYCEPEISVQFNKYLFLFIVIATSYLATFLVGEFASRFFYMIPYPLSVLLLMAFFDRKTTLAVYGVSLLPLLLFIHGGLDMFIVFFAAGVVCSVTNSFFSRGWTQFLNCMFVFITFIAVYTALYLMRGFDEVYGKVIVFKLLMASIFTVVGYPAIGLAEILFKLVSTSRLQELCETSNPLLMELNAKAPGTFQHVLQVANMSEAVSRSIGADPVLARAGAIYHDIGKMVNPMCFVENSINGVNDYHKELSPLESAKEIIRHVQDGEILADKNNLPDVVKAFISSHHGTSCVSYFYNTFIQGGGSESERPSFCYPGPNPRTREQVVVMICDSVEAASRTINDFSEESVDKFIEHLVNSKVREDQMIDADISIREIGLIKQELKAYIQQMHHRRVKYPRLTPGPSGGLFRKYKNQL